MKSKLRRIVTFLIWFVLLAYVDSLARVDQPVGLGLKALWSSLLDWMSETLVLDIAHTLSRVIIGFFLAMIAGVSVGLLTGTAFSIFGGAIPVIHYLRAITPVALTPFFVIAFGIGELSKLMIITWGAFFPIWLSTHIGLRSLPPDTLSSVRLFGLSNARMFKHFFLPASIKCSYPGARIALGISFILVYVSETLGAEFGIGYMLSVSYDTIQIPRMLLALLTFGFLGLLSDKLFSGLAEYLFPWITESKKNGNSS